MKRIKQLLLKVMNTYASRFPQIRWEINSLNENYNKGKSYSYTYLQRMVQEMIHEGLVEKTKYRMYADRHKFYDLTREGQKLAKEIIEE